MIGVLLENGSDVFQHFLAVPRLEGAGQAKVQIRVVGEFLQPDVELFGGQIEVVLVEGQFAEREINLAVVGVGLAGRFQNIVLHLAGVGPEEQRGPPDGEQAGGITNAPVAPRSNQRLDLLKRFRRAVRVAAVGKNFMRQQPQWHAPRVTVERVREGNARFDVTTKGEL